MTSLIFDRSGARLASGAKDTNIILWDLVSEVGLFKLRGHKDQITGLQFLYPTKTLAGETDVDELAETDTYALLSTGKDALIKVWDLSSQHCIETHVAQTNGECWAVGVSPDMTGCLTAGNEGELRIWSIDLQILYTHLSGTAEDINVRVLHEIGVIYREGKDKTLGIHFHPQADYIAVHGSEKAVEILRVRDDAEAKKVMARKRKRRREKAGEAETDTVDGAADGEEESLATNEIFVPHTIVRTGGKVRSFAWTKSKDPKKLQMVSASTNNLIEHYSVAIKASTKKSSGSTNSEYDRISSLDLPGHRADVRALALSSDDKMLATASNGALKIWNVRSRQCIRTLECGYALCCSFIPGDRLAIVGNKEGELELFDIASSTLLDTLKAHDGPIWSLDIHPNGRSMATGSADKTVKFWNFEIKQDKVEGADQAVPRFKLVHNRTLKVSDDVLKISFSPDSRLIAVATLDNTVKIFFLDFLKLFLNLYGHKLPVLDMSISSDSKLIATCSADKNVRLWGLDFGDCHKAFFAHNESVMQVSFIPHPVSREDGHLFFSASKDKLVKTWDGDKFEQIQKLEGHHGEIWAMVLARTGDFVVTASHDKSFRIWSQTDEPIFLEEERERELEELYESTLQAQLGDDEEAAAGENGDNNVAAASKQTIQTLTAGEKIAEALELGLVDLEVVRKWKKQKAVNPNIAPPQRDPLFMALGNISAEKHVLNTVAKIPAAQLHDALLVLPFSMLPALFTFIAIWLRRQWNVSLTCRVLFFMLSIHQRQLVASGELRTILEGMREDLRTTLAGIKDVLGFNLAAMKFVGQKIKDDALVRLEDAEQADETSNRRKRTFVDVA